ncbi:MAG TPA: hypothetical protein VGV59_11520 [Pyrinomonadaceae bacterium]|nr:hypothetical protein [Pyrinomonadaceae bacterium]
MAQRGRGNRASTAAAQRAARAAEREEEEFGPIVRAYLGYLRAQQEVVDDRASRREVNPAYYLRNSNRIKALRRMAVQIARETENDYLPELEAVSLDEFDTLFDEPPKPASLSVGLVLNYTFRYLGAVTVNREKFYLFARLDPYEQAELRKNAAPQSGAGTHASSQPAASTEPNSRPRRVNSP